MPKPIFKKTNFIKLVLRSVKLNELSNPDIEFNIFKKNSSTEINCDEEQLNRVFINLIKNSIESIDEKKTKNVDFKGKIIVDIAEYSDYIYVKVIDNGVSFKKVDKEKMLTPYFTTKRKGTGLGLSIVTKIVSDHNGAITFISTSSGAQVEINLPKNYEQ